MLDQAKRFAGSALRVGGNVLGPATAVFDVMSLMNRDAEGKDSARVLAEQMVDAGYTQGYDSIMAMAQNNPALERAIGDVGVSDYFKTAAGIGLQAGDFLGGGPLGFVTAPLGAVAQIDQQRKKHGRSQAFKDAYENALIQRGLV
jgi:hypothetical protein